MLRCFSIPFFLCSIFPVFADDAIEEIVVSADFYQRALSQTSSSISVLGAENIERQNVHHLEEILNLAPNVNFSSGGSRGKYIQIRGIGERSQFIEPINPSVGVLVDGFDLSGIAGAATTLDVHQIEILRGPQGTTFGSNALAGIVNIQSAMPTEDTYTQLSAGVGNFNTTELSAVRSNTLDDAFAYRLAIGQVKSNGYTENTFLNRDDTQNIDELTTKGKLRFTSSKRHLLDLNLLYVNTDNGYDAFSLDNTPNETQSDEPGKDRQTSRGIGIDSSYEIAPALHLKTLVNHIDSDIEYSYDEDWTDPDLCSRQNCADLGYSSFDKYQRNNRNETFDTKLISDIGTRIKWTGGVYYQKKRENLNRTYTFDAPFNSRIEYDTSALYGQIDYELGDSLTASVGARYEYRDSNYGDSRNIELANIEDMLGFKLSLERVLNTNHFVYAAISRGYKAGGFNPDDSIPVERFRKFEQEILENYEIGFKGTSIDKFSYELALFYLDRDDAQIKQSFQTDIMGGFSEYIDNATEGVGYGLEANMAFQASEKTKLWLSAGLLETKFDDFASFSHVEADQDGNIAHDLSDRALPHAPSYQFATGIVFALNESLSLSLSADGKDEFYFSASHNELSKDYIIYNANVSYEQDAWKVSAWVKNIADEEIQTRGFFFGNDPRDGYTAKPYYQYGAPRTFGITASIEL